MKKIIFVITFILTFTLNTFSQTKDSKIDYLTLSIGQGYGDGIIWLNWYPTLGIGYERELNRFFSVDFQIYSYYRAFKDYYFLTDDGSGHPIFDIIIENAYGPFITQEDLDKIKNVGIKDLDASLIIKEFSLPVTLDLNFTPILFKGHSLGITGGIGFCYSTNNYSKDYFPIKKLTLNDGSVYEYIQLSLGTEFRSIDPFIEHIALFYEFKLDDYKFGFKFGEYGYNFGNYGSYNWDSSIYFKLKL